MSTPELNYPPLVLDGSVRAVGGEQRLCPILAHDGLPGGSSALRNELVVLPDRAAVITQITFAVCDSAAALAA